MDEWMSCPKCHSDDLDTSILERDINVAWARAECMKCHFAWNEVYTFLHNEAVDTNIKLDDNGNPQGVLNVRI
jgi:C4-type Zn-finger protein